MMNALKITAVIIEIIFLLWFILPAFFRIFKAGNILGVALCLILLYRTAFSSVYNQMDSALLSQPVTKVLWIIAKTAFFMFLIYAAAVSICMIIAMKIKPADDATAVILGAQVKPWGASRLLKQRIYAAEKYLNGHPRVKAVASGGKGENEPMSEAECIREFMIKDGIEPERIIVENRSVNTEQNLLYSLSVIKEEDLGGCIAIISDSYHQLRARIVAYKIDRDIRVGACNTENTKFGYFVYPSYFVREWIAIPVEILKKVGQPAKHRKI